MSSENHPVEDGFDTVENARKVLGFKDTITLTELKSIYRNLIKQFHPDQIDSPPNAHQKTVEIIHAYEIILNYCQNYPISFSKESFTKFNPLTKHDDAAREYTAQWQAAYGNDPLWGGTGHED